MPETIKIFFNTNADKIRIITCHSSIIAVLCKDTVMCRLSIEKIV